MTEPTRQQHKLKVKASLFIGNDGNVSVALYPTDVKSAILLGRFYLANEVHGAKIDMGAFGQCAEDERDAPMHMVDVSISAYRKPKATKELKEIFDRRHALATLTKTTRMRSLCASQGAGMSTRSRRRKGTPLKRLHTLVKIETYRDLLEFAGHRSIGMAIDELCSTRNRSTSIDKTLPSSNSPKL